MTQIESTPTVSILDRVSLGSLWPQLWAPIVIGAVSILLGLWVLSLGERHVKRRGTPKRSG
jgi:hypothetical protein